ncbi:MAG: hypothetical protein KBG20_14925 [Caldilineaceae bacterium]|nr:hypothetical protein [Caldilineaceae bacterium]MBP8110598.1 hypothetical protein [Caldilineaceae bacterium]MBP8125752.1 hypothetical protein [Caldilineaceae bacterium]MBP9073598.1 hypothetical protein [Caldilineaceae bacterium]
MSTTSPTLRRPAKTGESGLSGSTALWIGIVFSFAVTGLIWLLGARLDSVQLLPDQGASWYVWKLPEPTFWTRLTAWGFYAVHQVFIWGLIAYAQRNKLKYTDGLHTVNLIALGGNAAFMLLRVVQTHIWYDGLAQDVSIWSSQWSVILLLVLVLLMENPRRGMFFGKKAPLNKQVISFVRKYHGYIFSWGMVYTFWYHPTIATTGHLVGFFYMFMIMLQGSLFFTRIHLNKYWMVTQEVLVVFHGTLVAVLQGNGIWPMFAFGFAAIFIITQMHGLGWAKWAKWIAVAAYALAAVVVYSQRGLIATNEIIRIPAIEYLVVFALAGLIWLGLWVDKRIRGPKRLAAAGD